MCQRNALIRNAGAPGGALGVLCSVFGAETSLGKGPNVALEKHNRREYRPNRPIRKRKNIAFERDFFGQEKEKTH